MEEKQEHLEKTKIEHEEAMKNMQV